MPAPRKTRRITEYVTLPGLPPLVVVRSTARTKSVSARALDDGSVRLSVPAALGREEVIHYAHRIVPKVFEQYSRKQKEKAQRATDEFLFGRARVLAQTYLPELKPERLEQVSIRWVTNQGKRWGSCTPAQSSIRISHTLQGAADYALDFVIYHELCHLLESTHNARFKALENRYEERQKAAGFLEGVTFMSDKK